MTTSVTNTKEADATKRTKRTNKTIKFVSTKKTKLVLTEKYDDDSVNTTNQQTAKLYVKYSPTKVGYKGMKWKAKSRKIVYVSPYGVVTPVKAGSTKIYGYTKDGTNKKVTINVTVNKKPATATAKPNYEVDNRVGTMVENFEDYDLNEKWERYTKGKEYVDSNCGDMMVVQDPENPKNKVLRIRYNGDTQAYDYAPIISLNLKTKTLENYSAVRLKSRVVANAPDCTYKAAYVYFGKRNTITADHYFATSTKPADAMKKTTDKSSKLYGLTQEQINELLKFDVEKPMAIGTKTEYNVRDGVNAGKKYINKYFPMYYSDYEKGDKTAVAAGYKESDAGIAGFQSNTIEFQPATIKQADAKLYGQSRLDMAVGSTYSGKYPSGQYVTLYIDDIEMLEGDIPIQKLELEAQYTNTISVGKYVKIAPAYTPENTTFTELKWSSSDTGVATVDEYGKVTGVKAGKATITATCVKDNKVSKSVEITVTDKTPASGDKVLDLTHFTEKNPEKDLTEDQAKWGSDVQAEKTASGIKLPFTENNQCVVFKLPETIDVTSYEGISIRALTDYQISLELYDESFDKRYGDRDDNEYGESFKAYNWYDRYQWCTYPFYKGSVEGRAEDGTPTDKIAAETNFYKFAEDGTIRGSLNKVKYVIIKSNQFKKDGSCEIYNVTLLKDKPTKKYEN